MAILHDIGGMGTDGWPSSSKAPAVADLGCLKNPETDVFRLQKPILKTFRLDPTRFLGKAKVRPKTALEPTGEFLKFTEMTKSFSAALPDCISLSRSNFRQPERKRERERAEKWAIE